VALVGHFECDRTDPHLSDLLSLLELRNVLIRVAIIFVAFLALACGEARPGDPGDKPWPPVQSQTLSCKHRKDDSSLESRTAVAVYKASDPFLPCIVDAARMFRGMGVAARVITREDVVRGELRNYRLLYMPGGWAPNFIADLHPKGESKIREFVRAGGAYLGVCAGAYFACDHVVWDGKRYDYSLDLFAGGAVGPIREIAPWPGFALTKIVFSEAARWFAPDAAVHWTLYYGGPYFVNVQEAGGTVLARFVLNGQPAIIEVPFGKGRVVLMSPHMEIDVGSPWKNMPGLAEALRGVQSHWPAMKRLVVGLLAPARRTD